MLKLTRKNESGRSMVEMLGVLAIVGVLSIGGIAGYTAAMNTQRANDAVTHALRLATLASGKRLMSPTAVLEPSELAGTGFEFANEDPDGFTLTISNLSPAVIAKINKMKTDIAAATVSDDGNSVTFKFKNDLGEWDANGGQQGQGEPTVDGYTDNDGSDCTADTKIGGDNSCQVCVKGLYMDSDAKCSAGQICLGGVCTTPTGSDTGCTRNSECTGEEIDGLAGEGYETIIDCDNNTCFCYYTDGGQMRSGSSSGPDKGSGRCMLLEYDTLTVATDGFSGKMSKTTMDWFSAKNFCNALGSSMASASDVDINLSSLGQCFEEDSACGSGDTCTCEGISWDDYKGRLSGTYWWTKDVDPWVTEHVILVNTFDERIAYRERNDSDVYALCR